MIIEVREIGGGGRKKMVLDLEDHCEALASPLRCKALESGEVT